MSREKPDDQVIACADMRLPCKVRLEILLTGRVSVRAITPIDIIQDTDGKRYANAHPGTMRLDTDWPRIFKRRPGMMLDAARSRPDGEGK